MTEAEQCLELRRLWLLAGKPMDLGEFVERPDVKAVMESPVTTPAWHTRPPYDVKVPNELIRSMRL